MSQAVAADRKPHVVVVGSVNMDLVARVERLPRPGETVHGRELIQSPGGKGANQAVAVARLGGRCTLIARVGDDGFGGTLAAGLASWGVNTDHVTVTDGCSSGVALIGVEDGGENAITIVSGANGRLTPDDVGAQEELIAAADVVLVQLEVPLETVEAALRIARAHGVPTVLDPAPAPREPPPETLFDVEATCPNQAEAEALTGVAVTDPESAKEAAQALRQRGVRHAVITLGAGGALLCDEGGRCELVPAPAVAVVDTTASGDAFAAAFGLGRAEGQSPLEAVRFGCAAGSLAATRLGAQRAMPDRGQVEALQAGGA
jgi:ribokinase